MRGRGYAAVRFGDVIVVGIYMSPSRRLADFEGFLGVLGSVINRVHPCPVLVLAGFDAKSTAWNSPATYARGGVLEEWAISTGLLILNRAQVTLSGT